MTNSRSDFDLQSSYSGYSPSGAHSPPARPSKKLRSGNAIARPPNGFFMYRSEQLEVLREVEKDQRIISRTIGHMWKNLVQDERASWNERAAQRKREHISQHPDYEFKPKPRSKPVVRRKVKRNGEADLERCKRLADILQSGKEGPEFQAAVQALGPPTDSGSEAQNAVMSASKGPPPQHRLRKDRQRHSSYKSSDEEEDKSVVSVSSPTTGRYYHSQVIRPEGYGSVSYPASQLAPLPRPILQHTPTFLPTLFQEAEGPSTYYRTPLENPTDAVTDAPDELLQHNGFADPSNYYNYGPAESSQRGRLIDESAGFYHAGYPGKGSSHEYCYPHHG